MKKKHFLNEITEIFKKFVVHIKLLYLDELNFPNEENVCKLD